jgi:hypothetical protein
VSAARSRDRRVYLYSHPMLFALVAATRRRRALRLGGTVLVHDREVYVTALTRIPLDRTAEGTTGGLADRLPGAGGLFDQQGDDHRRTRRSTADLLGAAGVARLRPIWMDVLNRRLAPLADGAEVDLVPIAAELAGATATALLGLRVDPVELADAALAATAVAARAHLPGPGRRRAARTAGAAIARLTSLVAAAGDRGLATTLAAAAITTTVAALPRAAAWAADAGLWAYADGHLVGLADEMLRVTAPTPLLPRVVAAAGDLFAGPTPGRPPSLPSRLPAHPQSGGPSLPAGSDSFRPSSTAGCLMPTAGQAPSPAAHPELGGPSVPARSDSFRPLSTGRCPVRPGDRLLLVARHAVEAHQSDPNPLAPASPQVAQLVFGAGPHACPGAKLARAQIADLLAALAPYRPVVTRAWADRRSALPSWRSLVIRATRPTRPGEHPTATGGPGTDPDRAAKTMRPKR